MGTNILKANELPPGARIMGRQGRALNGMELASGLTSLVEQRLGDDGRLAIDEKLALEWWPSLHLTFPRAVVEWCDSKNEDGTIGIWLRCLLGTGKVWEFCYLDEGADIRELKKLGPFGTPDDMRDALGLPRIAQFKLPSGEIVTAELPGQHLRQRDSSPLTIKFTQEDKDAAAEQLAQVPQLIKRPSDDIEVVRKEAGEAVARMEAKSQVSGGFVTGFTAGYNTPLEELLAEPPAVETAPAPAKPIEPPKKAGLRKAAAKGVKK